MSNLDAAGRLLALLPSGTPQVGDVATVTSVDPLELEWSAQSGPSGQADRAIYSSSLDFTAGTSPSVVQWNPTPSLSHGRALMDFTDVQNPAALIAGTYAISIWGQAPTAAGKNWALDFELDEMGDDPTWEVTAPLDGLIGGATSPTVMLTGIWYLPLGAQWFVTVSQDTGSAFGPTLRAYVQLLYEA